MRKLKIIIKSFYIILFVVMLIIVIMAINYFKLLNDYKNSRANIKYGELPTEHIAELDYNWTENSMLESVFTEAEYPEYDKADFNSDMFWIFIHDQTEYNEYQIVLGLPQYTLPSDKKCYIISLGRQIKNFYVLPLVMDRKDYTVFEQYFELCDNLKEPCYRGIAKYEANYYNENKINIYSTDKLDLINLSNYVTKYKIE